MPEPVSTRTGWGRVPQDALLPHPGNENYPLRAGLRRADIVAAPAGKTLYLRRALQIDQGNTPWCVEASARHAELALPTHYRRQQPFGALYAECKKYDGYPHLDGTDAHALLEALRREGRVVNYYWYDGSDRDAARLWIRSGKSALLLGAYWSYQMAERTDPKGRLKVEGKLELGHETAVIGYRPDRKGWEWECVQSWGNHNYGVLGRFFLADDDTGFWRLVDYHGDLAGWVEPTSLTR